MARRILVIVLFALCIVRAGMGGGRRSADGSPPTSGTVPVYGYTLIDSFPHDPNAYTQGLVYKGGFIYEGTGLYGGSSLRKVVLETGEVVKRRNLASAYFGEGVTVRCDTIYQLTWQNNTGFVYEELEEFELIETFSYDTQGWGLTHDDTSLIMSDGSDKLYYLDPHTYEEVGRIYVTAEGAPVYQLNELELIRGRVYANIWHSDSIAVIEPGTGEVVAWLDLSSIFPYPRPGVLNGIAFDPDSVRLFVTGKKWPGLFEIWVDPLDYAPEIVAFSPPAHVCAYIDSPVVLSVSVEDLDPTDSLEYTWSINGLVEPLAEGSSYIYSGSTSVVDTVVASVSDGIFSDSTTWTIYVEIAGVDGDRGRGGPDNAGFDTYMIEPNPVRGSATITFTVGAGSESSHPVLLTVHDVSGRRVACLLDSDVTPGDYLVAWDCRDDRGRRVSPGVYFCVLNSGRVSHSRKVAVLK